MTMIDERPYAGTSGWSGSAASQDRAARDDAAGVTSVRQTIIYGRVIAALYDGLTVAELREDRELGHHGTISGALSVLHMKGYLDRLADQRDRCSIYVAPQYVDGRRTVPHKSWLKNCECGHDRTEHVQTGNADYCRRCDCTEYKVPR